jgi:hypothetical protein
MKKLVLGFTGSRTGMNDFQKDAFCSRIEKHLEKYDTIEFHHGDCTGADAEAHELIRGFILTIKAPIKIIIHPGDLNKHRAFSTDFDTLLEAKDPLIRNRDIVRASRELIAVPNTKLEQRRSGTWATIRFARNTSVKTYLIYPSETELCLNKKKSKMAALFAARGMQYAPTAEE